MASSASNNSRRRASSRDGKLDESSGIVTEEFLAGTRARRDGLIVAKPGDQKAAGLPTDLSNIRQVLIFLK